MSRHRDVRNLDYDQEYNEAYDDAVYGHSVDEYDCGVSPSTEQYLYSQKGDANYGFGAYFPGTENIKEEEEDSGENSAVSRRDSSNDERPRLSSEDEVRLHSVLDELRNVVGDQFSEEELVRAVLKHRYDFEASLNAILNQRSTASSGTATRNQPISTQNPPISTQIPHMALVTKSRKQYTSCTTQPEERCNDARTTSPVIVTTPGRSVVKGFVLQENGEINDHDEVEEAADEVELPPLQIQEENREKEAAPPPRPPARLRDKELDINKKYEELRGTTKNFLNLVVVGHVDAGKSTLMGHLLYLQGNVAQRVMHKYEQESKKVGKQSFMYAWVLDDTEEERSRGITVDVAQRIFETSSKTINLLDAPGHRDFIPNMITGAARADVGVLVVDASRGGFEAGFDSGGQTREHAILTRSLGLSELAVAINKLDTVNWSEERFKEIENSLKHFLKTVGYKESDVVYVPCSGLTGQNLVQPPTGEVLKDWYRGPTLLEAIDKLKVPERAINRPIRFCVSDVYKGQGSSMCVAGRLETGYVQNGDRLMLMPQAEVVGVKAVQTENTVLGHAFAGDHVTLNVSRVDSTVLRVGDFLCDPQFPISQTTKIQARIVVFNITVPIIKGSQFDIHYQSVCEMARVRKLVSQLHKSTGQVIKQRPRALVKNSSAIIELEFDRPLCLEVYKDYKELGRFMLRNNGVTVAAGMVTQIFD